ncbi:MAG: hypothetical protein JWO38_5803 [Gemmataceae bacterium]|nr:hypothetical protein [Gemmataceae bacterium]
MPLVKCSVGGCSRRLQPVLKVHPQDRDTWLYPGCEECSRAACEEHSSWGGDRVVCDRCRRAIEGRPSLIPLIELGIRSFAE